MMIFRTHTAVFALLATFASVGVVKGNERCPLVDPGDTPCGQRNLFCNIPTVACEGNMKYQCNCADAKLPFNCQCRGDLGLQSTDNVTDVEALDIGDESVDDESGAFSATVFSSVMVSGAVAAFAASL